MSILTASIPVPSSGDGTIVSVANMIGPKTVQLAGQFSGYYDLLASHDDVNFVAVASFSAGGLEGIRVDVVGAFKSLRLRANARPVTTVTCEVSAVSGAGQNGFGTIATLAAGYSGTTPIVDTSTFVTPDGSQADTNFICRGNFEGSIVVLGSINGSEFNPIGEFRVDRRPEGSPAIVELSPLLAGDNVRYFRLQVNLTTGTVSVTFGGSVRGTGYALTDLSNLTPTGINQSLVPDVAGSINLGSTSQPWGNLYLAGNTVINPAGNNWFVTGVATAARTLTLPDVSGVLFTEGNVSAGSGVTITPTGVGSAKTFSISANPGAISLTPGSIPFGSAGGSITENNAFLFWNDTSHWLGIGTNAPTGTVEIHDGSPALKIVGPSRLDRVELALVQDGITARRWGGYFQINPTTSDLVWVTRNDNSDSTQLSILNAAPNYVGLGTVAPTAKLQIKTTNIAVNDDLLISRNNDVILAGIGTDRVTTNDTLFSAFGSIRFYTNSTIVGGSLPTNEAARLTTQGNFVLGATAAGTTSAKTFALSNTATAPTTSTDLCHLYAADISAGSATLAIFAEAAVAVDIGLASTHSFTVFINGSKYKLMLVSVP